MSKTVLNLGIRVSSRLIASSLLLRLLSLLGIGAIATASVPLLLAQSQSFPENNSMAEGWIEHWQAKDVFLLPISVIFAPECKLFILVPTFV